MQRKFNKFEGKKQTLKSAISLYSLQQQRVALQTARLTINAYINISTPFWQPQAHREQRKMMSHCALVISLYMYITFMHLLFFLVHMFVADQQLFFQIKRVEGRYRASSPPLPSGAEGKPPAEKTNLF